ncbi:hypothetical protein PsorP6_017847 [Peronosclerospora sorghi]|uniref:Uncharacterized protein n=1 Tax=Peronosclerospora sorghi TaxID=230839 RepID=A0ACC0WDV5_9STRA|nr:hypothetical protein PsorP6_017847 [Peronosclerospora sorghi]
MDQLLKKKVPGAENASLLAQIIYSNTHNPMKHYWEKTIWSVEAYESAMVSKQQKVYIERFEISIIDVTITARVSIPVLNSFDGIPLHFGATVMRDVFAFPDQLIKELAADYVADTIRFFPKFGQGVRDLVEMPLAASQSGYSPWVLTKDVVGGVASFLGHTTSATLASFYEFSYSFSPTVD